MAQFTRSFWRILIWLGIGIIVGLIISWWVNRSAPQHTVTLSLSGVPFVTLSLFDALFWLGAAIVGMITAVWAWRDVAWGQRQEEIRQDTLIHWQNFLERLDHELKNPLMIIQAVVENALAEVRGRDGVTHETLTTINSQTARMSRLVNDLRKISEIETLTLDITDVDLDMLLKDVFSMAEEHPDAAERRFSLRIPEAPWPLPTIRGDWDLLFLALYNLLENSIKYSQKDDLIVLKAREEGESVYIEIADTGIGMAEDDLLHVWDELHRGENARGLEGSGLGLALTHAIIRRHGGEVSAKSRLHKGSEMTITLPIKQK